jgi:hypothetical protein
MTDPTAASKIRTVGIPRALRSSYIFLLLKNKIKYFLTLFNKIKEF